MPHTLASQPWIRPRSSTEYRSPTTVSATGWMAPAPTPCSRRNTISDDMDQAKPHSVEPRRNTAIPTSSTGLRP